MMGPSGRLQTGLGGEGIGQVTGSGATEGFTRTSFTVSEMGLSQGLEQRRSAQCPVVRKCHWLLRKRLQGQRVKQPLRDEILRTVGRFPSNRWIRGTFICTSLEGRRGVVTFLPEYFAAQHISSWGFLLWP